jgi:Arc/MetJ family transcription regulator
MTKINVSLDADLVIDVMLLSGVNNAQDAVELVVRDYLVRGRRTEAVTGNAEEARQATEADIRRQDGGG